MRKYISKEEMEKDENLLIFFTFLKLMILIFRM